MHLEQLYYYAWNWIDYVFIPIFQMLIFLNYVWNEFIYGVINQFCPFLQFTSVMVATFINKTQ